MPITNTRGGLSRQTFTTTPYFKVFTPKSIPGCTLWLDASQDTTANGVSIASLVDRSGSGNSLTPSGTISAATNFLRGRTVYNFGSSRASKSNFPWQTSFTQIVLVKCATGNWLSSLVSIMCKWRLFMDRCHRTPLRATPHCPHEITIPGVYSN